MQKTVLITGCSSGFGKLIAETLLKQGYTVFATMILLDTISAEPAKELKAFAEKTSGTVHILEIDVTDTNSVTKAIDKAVALEGKIDVLVNNAGIGGVGWTETFTERQFEKMFAVNVFGVQRMMKAVLPQMRQRNDGLIINISSIQGRVVFPYSGLYTATKFAVEGLTESYHYELAPLGIEAVMIQPGGFQTNFESTAAGGAADKERIESYGALATKYHKVWGVPGESKDFLPQPQPVPDAIVALIEKEKGTRPLRTIVDPLLEGEGTSLINESAAKAQQILGDKLEWFTEESKV